MLPIAIPGNKPLLVNLIKKLNSNIDSYNKLNTAYSQKIPTANLSPQDNRNKLYIILAEEMYWNNLLESDYIDEAQPFDNIKIRCQQRKACYQKALMVDESSLTHHFPIADAYNYQNWAGIIPNTKTKKLARFKIRFEQIKNKAASVPLEIPENINQLLSLVLSIIGICDQLIIHFIVRKKYKNFHVHKIVNTRLECIRIALELSQKLIYYLELQKKYGHPDELHILLADMQQAYPHAAITASGNPKNLLPVNQLYKTYKNLTLITKLKNSVPIEQQKSINIIEGQFVNISIANLAIKSLANQTLIYERKDKRITRLVTNVHIADSIRKAKSLITETITDGQQIIDVLDYCKALEANQLALETHQKLVQNMGWTFSILERLFSTQCYQIYQSVENTLIHYKQQLKNWSEDGNLSACIAAEVKAIFTDNTNFFVISTQLQKIFTHFNARSISAEIQPHIIAITSYYQHHINKSIIAFIITHWFDIAIKEQLKHPQSPLLKLRGILGDNHINHLLKLIYSIDTKNISPNTLAAVNVYLHNFGYPTLSQIQKKINAQVESTIHDSLNYLNEQTNLEVPKQVLHQPEINKIATRDYELNQKVKIEIIQTKIAAFRKKISAEHSFETLIIAFEQIVQTVKAEGLTDYLLVKQLRELYKEICAKANGYDSARLTPITKNKKTLKYLEITLDPCNYGQSTANAIKKYNSKFFSRLEIALKFLDTTKICQQQLNALTL